MRAILIKPDQPLDPVEVIEYDGDWRKISKLLSYEKHDVSIFTCVYVDENHTLLVDDEGLLHGPEHFFIWPKYPQPLAGRGLILGDSPDGDSVSATLDVEWVRKSVLCASVDVIRRIYR